MFKIKNIKKSKLAAVAIGTAVKVLTAVVCGAVVLTGTYGVVKHTVLPTSTAKTKSMFAYEGGADTGGGSGGSAGDNPVYETEIKRLSGEAVPEGATYKLKNGTVLTVFPDAPAKGDVYEEGDYKYSFGLQGYAGGDYGTEWSVKTKSTSKTEYGEIISEIAGKPITNMYWTFANCTSLLSSPSIPDSVIDMSGTFYCCKSLNTAPVIPDKVKKLNSTFTSCKALEKAPVIPDNVEDIVSIFTNCRSLKTYEGSTDADGDFSKYKLPSKSTNLTRVFDSCPITKSPTIREGVSILYATFENCKLLTVAPNIPNSVTNMCDTFNGCEKLNTAPVIPNSVNNMTRTFKHCSSINGNIIINANPTSFNQCFNYTNDSIVLTGDSNILEKISATITTDRETTEVTPGPSKNY